MRPMMSLRRAGQREACRAGWLIALVLCLALHDAPVRAAEPIKIGFSIALTGGLAANGKQVLVAMQIWRDDVNAKGGLLGRPVELIYFDDQSTGTQVPGIYTKLIEIDKVDLTVGPYGTNMVVPALPVLIQHGMATVGITAQGANLNFHYPKYFSMNSVGPDPRHAFAEGFFAVAMEQKPTPTTVALVVADAELGHISAEGARDFVKQYGLKLVYDRAYPPNTTDFSPIIRAVQATQPDLVYNAGYPPDTIGMIRAAAEIGLKTRMFGGTMIGLLSTTFRTQLGPLLNGVISTADIYVPSPSFDFPGSRPLLAKYQTLAKGEGIDPYGYNFAPLGYAAMQVLAAGVEGAQSLDQDKIGQWLHEHSVSTVAGDLSFGPDGEWTKGRQIVSQFQHVAGHDVDQFKDMSKQVIVWPPQYKTGDLIYPYTDALK
jgi:branched-chain amino acid transport system substrate-binding protein